MASDSPASKFIAESVNHSEWLNTIESTRPEAVVTLAKDHGFDCTFDDLKQAASELLAAQNNSNDQGTPNAGQVNEAASGMSDFENDTGYGSDTGSAALYGVAGMILKM